MGRNHPGKRLTLAGSAGRAHVARYVRAYSPQSRSAGPASPSGKQSKEK
jgi:hypothetical protein